MMGRSRHIIEQLLLFIALSISLFMTWNYAKNMHIHIRPDGTVITHAHPFEEDNEPLSGSNHSRNELYLLQTLMVIALPNVCIALAQACQLVHLLIAVPIVGLLCTRLPFQKWGRAPPLP